MPGMQDKTGSHHGLFSSLNLQWPRGLPPNHPAVQNVQRTQEKVTFTLPLHVEGVR